MEQTAVRDIRRRNIKPTPGKADTDSNRFPGHSERMAAHIHRIRNHKCERTDGTWCKDCIRRKRR